MEEELETFIILDEKPDKCIECEGKVLPIMYGLPSKEGMQALERGEYVWGLAGHPVESIRFEGFELISVEKKTLPDQGDMDTSAYCFKREEAKTKEN